jgi:hypothetical protein
LVCSKHFASDIERPILFEQQRVRDNSFGEHVNSFRHGQFELVEAEYAFSVSIGLVRPASVLLVETIIEDADEWRLRVAT